MINVDCGVVFGLFFYLIGLVVLDDFEYLGFDFVVWIVGFGFC